MELIITCLNSSNSRFSEARCNENWKKKQKMKTKTFNLDGEGRKLTDC